MIQNAGALMFIIGVILVLLLPVGAILINLLNIITKGRFPITNIMGVVLGISCVLGVVLMFVGDSYRKDISKDVMLTYYNQNIAYVELTPAQQKNISTAMANIRRMQKEKKDMSKYLPALEKYVAEKTIVERNCTQQEAEEYAKEIVYGS